MIFVRYLFVWLLHPLQDYSGINQVLRMLEYTNHDLTPQHTLEQSSRQNLQVEI